MNTIHPDVLAEFKTFLTSLIREEAASVPRGVIHNASRASKSRDWVLSGIPSFLHNQYEKSKIPGVNQGLAAGLLFSFEPPFEEHSGKRARRYFVNCAKSYRNMLDSLIHEVPIQPSEWHRNMLLPNAWTMFMTKLYNACVQGRNAELVMQQSRSHVTDPSELRDKTNNAWLWVRDQITEQLKTASRGSPSVQGNSVLALAGLAFAVSCYASQLSLENQSDGFDGLDTSKTDQEALRTKEWLLMVADTLVVVLDGNYKPRGVTLVWCQQVSSPKSTASSLLARACAALSLSQLAPTLASVDPERIRGFTDALKLRIPGQSKAGSSAVMQVHCGLGLGLLLSKLYQEHYSELAGKEGYLMITTALDALETAGLSTDLDNTEGACLGMGLALSALCSENIVDSRVHVQSMRQKIIGLLQDSDKEPNQRLQTLCFNFALVSSNAFHTGIINKDGATSSLDILHKLVSMNDQAPGISLSLGLYLHELFATGHASAMDFVTQHLETWKHWMESKDSPTLKQLCGVNGLMALLGSERGFFQMERTVNVEQFGKGVFSAILKSMQSTVTSPYDMGLASNIAWLLGHVYAASTASNLTRSSVPDSYSYLSEFSILRAVFDFLITAGKTGPYQGVTRTTVDVVLGSLVDGPRVPLPPVNWASVLGPLMRNSFGSKIESLCLQFAVVQAKSSSTLPPFLSSWISTAVFANLDTDCKKELFESLSRLVNVVPLTRVQEFLEGPVVTSFDPGKETAIPHAILEGLCSVLQMREPPPSVFGWASSSVQTLYLNYCLAEAQHSETQDSTGRLIGRCLAELAPEIVEKLTQTPSAKSALFRGILVSMGKAKLRWLSAPLNWILSSEALACGERELILGYLIETLSRSSAHKTDERLQWLLDLTGQIRIAACDTKQRMNTSQVLSYGLTVLSSICAAWGRNAISADRQLGQRLRGQSFDSLLRMLPGILQSFLGVEPWDKITPKMLEWLFSLRDSPGVKQCADLGVLVQECLLQLRHTDEFKKAAVWTEACLDK